ncbi:hypothetical protein [Reichenbachiella sp. MALMAid0571]|uniref:hypothetical protein n=1 Tax=Reichenbachiella sp. MALMAid0571 TaxID=3143939 RepID=UPI0032DF44EB
MKKSIILCSLVLCFIVVGLAQKKSAINRSCSVVCLDDSWIPESYNAGAKNAIVLNAKGKISVHETNDVSDKSDYNRADFIEFKIAIFKKKFDSMVSFSDNTYTTVDAQKVLQQCETGDQIVIILKDADKFSLPHHRIDVL